MTESELDGTALRLGLLAGEVDNLLSDPRLRGGSPAVHRQLISLYYDTEDLALWRHGYELCTRWVEGNWMQILRDGRRKGLKGFEIIHQIAGREVDRSKLPGQGKAGGQLIKLLSKQALRPVFEIDLQRSLWDHSPGMEAQVKVVLDRGEIKLNGRREAVHELSLELAKGDAADFYAWVLELAEDYLLSWEAADKTSRGYDLFCSIPVSHHKAQAVPLTRETRSEDAFIAIARACVVQLQANLAATRAGQIEGVHQMRVALRRLRSCLKIFRPLIPKEASADLVEELRWLNGFLGPARDWDVFLESGMAPVFAYFSDRQDLQAMRRQADQVRQNHRQALYRCLAEPRYHRLLLRLHGWFSCRNWRRDMAKVQLETLDQPVIEFATPLLARDHRRVVKGGKAFSELTMEQRHGLRIRIKQLRYALEFFAGLYHGSRVKSYVKATAGLQDSLGMLNDASVAERLLDEAGIEKATPTRHLIEGWYACSLHQYEQQFIENWKHFMTCKPPWK